MSEVTLAPMHGEVLPRGLQAALRNNLTGEIRIYRDDKDEAYYRSIWDGDAWADTLRFYWSEGTLGCDCNRRLHWQYAGGLDEHTADWSGPCSYGHFSVPYLLLFDGTRMEIDDPETPEACMALFKDWFDDLGPGHVLRRENDMLFVDEVEG